MTSAGSGGLTVACVVQLTSGAQWVVHEGAEHQAPPEATHPLLRLRGGDHEDTILFDLRRIPDLRRALVYAVPTPGAGPSTGSLLFTTYGGTAVDIPFITAPPATSILASVHNVVGELVLRAEADVAPDPSAAWRAHGYEISGVR